MDVKYDKLDDLYAMLTIKIDESDYQPKVKKQLREINMSRPEPGFRPGKVPASLMERKYGKAAKYDVINREVSEALYNYIKDNGVKTLGDPVPQKNDSFNIEDKEFSFNFKVGLYPTVDVVVDKSMKIPYYTISVDDGMVKRQDDMLRNRYGKQVPGEEVEANSLVKGVITELNEDGTVKEGGIVMEGGIVSPQYFKSEDQRALFVGKKIGDMVRFNPAATCEGNEAEMSSMLGIDKEETAAHHGDFNFEIKEIIVLRPAELNQEYFDLVCGKDAVKDEDGYKAKLKEMIASQLVADSNYRFSVDAKEILLGKAGEVELPAESLKEAIRLNNEKITPEEVDSKYEGFRAELQWYVVRDTIGEALGVKVDDNDLRGLAAVIARQQFTQYGLNNVPDDALKRYVDQLLADRNTRERIASQAVDVKFFAAVKTAADIEEKTVSVEEFNKLFAKEEEKTEQQ